MESPINQRDKRLEDNVWLMQQDSIYTTLDNRMIFMIRTSL